MRKLKSLEYGDAGNVVESPTLKLQADNFIARHVTFKVKYDALSYIFSPSLPLSN